MKHTIRLTVAISLNGEQHAKFVQTQRKLGRATLGPVIADSALIGRPILEKLMLGGEGGLK